MVFTKRLREDIRRGRIGSAIEQMNAFGRRVIGRSSLAG